MSDFSLLYKKYNSVSSLTNGLNNSVLTLKRRNLVSKPGVEEQHPKLQVSDSEVEKAQKDISLILSDLEMFYQNQNIHNNLYELRDNPLFKNQILDNTEFRNQILAALEKVKSSKSLTNKDLSYIDKFISVLDNQASVLYRKLRTNRR
ncbi:hypothetical protein [Mucilaginibacter flavidus]|uniref:hypothetical protein n=1 Tax=Mucilaginibacter flavidus TaxID=2949309 RepID=UPI0020927419|nr:hypothetical protein [Mucilaginibacter flavidus]MCO5950529.1 hypothetical protein [Mucilaginibacter flavidus]